MRVLLQSRLVRVALVAIAGVLSTPLSSLETVHADALFSVSAVSGTFYPNPNNSGSFDNAQLSSPVFTQQFPVVAFNGYTQPCSNATGVTNTTRPFTDVIQNPDGSCSTLVAQGNGQQAGVGNLYQFEASFLGSVTLPTPGQVTFTLYSDDGWILGFGPVSGGTAQPTYVSGALTNAPSATPVKGYPVVGALNQSNAAISNRKFELTD